MARTACQCLTERRPGPARRRGGRIPLATWPESRRWARGPGRAAAPGRRLRLGMAVVAQTACQSRCLRGVNQISGLIALRLKDGTERSVWCTEKAHSMKHWGDTYATAGRAKNASTMVTETRMKSRSAVKVPAKKTNNHSESFGKSMLRNNMMMEAAMELSLHADRSG